MKAVIFEGTQGSGMALSGVAIAYGEWMRTGKPLCSSLGLGSYKYLDAREFIRELRRIRKEKGVGVG